jgi:hypothetical protein
MKRLATLLSAVLLLTIASFAQTTSAPAPSLWQNISVTGSAAGFLGNSAGSQVAIIAGGWFQATARVSIGYQQVVIPTTASFDFGMGQYSLPLNALLGKKISSKLKFDASQETFSVYGGLGRVTQSAQATGSVPVNRFAETIGVSLTIPLSANVGFTLISAQFLHGGTTTGLITTPSTSAISSGLKVSF